MGGSAAIIGQEASLQEKIHWIDRRTKNTFATRKSPTRNASFNCATILTQKASGPSAFRIFVAQSTTPEYGIVPSARGRMFCRRVLSRSKGRDVTTQVKPAMAEALSCSTKGRSEGGVLVCPHVKFDSPCTPALQSYRRRL